MSLRDRVPRLARHGWTVGWLWLVWVALWGSLSAPVLASGGLVALGIVLVFRLPPVTTAAVRPARVVLLVGHLLLSAIGAAAVIAWEAVRHGPRTHVAIVEVPLRADTDLLVTLVANLTTLTPGTLVLEIDRGRRTLYVHALPVRDAAGAERVRRRVRSVDLRVVRALGRRPEAAEETP
ncbi:Na+/H+ antiporter subunit E [Streptomyces sp. JJ38]|uniref:Na+/H+ antiporter subunit E n=1 Tax=Streptomyces sp. JJ38 TaxID=2738128 RepID=UPI001C586F1B|nr:Na+/H+ antiporter subunit E [Streptomyces sp. JJ38]MBW1599772.1 Na+/H+ antiporter subunit E [Streptomyces sp. JJ38]